MTSRKNTEELLKNLKESEERYRNLVENFPDTILVYNNKGRFVFVNQTGLKLLGTKSEADVLGKSLLDFVHPTYKKSISEVIRGAEKKKINQFELEVKLVDGRLLYLDVTATPITFKGEKVRQAVARDISERKKSEKSVLESEEKFKTLAEKSPNIIFINKGGRLEYVNKQGVETMGYSLDELYSQDFDFMNLIAPESRDIVRKNFEKHSKGKEVPPYEYRLVTKKGEEIIAIHTTKLIDYEGGKAILGIVTDITSRKQAEEKLRKSEEQLNSFIDSARDSYHLLNSEKRIIKINESALEALRRGGAGFSSKDDVKDKYFFEVYPFLKDSEWVGSIDEVLRKGKIFTSKDEVYHPELGVRYLEIEIFRVGEGVGIIARDITEKNIAVEQLRESQQFLKSIVDNSGDAIVITNMDGRITLWSYSAETIYGYKAEEVLGKDIRFLYPDELKEERQRWQSDILEGVTVRDIRTKIYNSKGELLDITLTLSPLMDKEGNRTGTIGLSSDIRERIEDEQKLQEKIAELERWQRLTVGREIRMVELKKELAEFKKKMK